MSGDVSKLKMPPGDGQNEKVRQGLTQDYVATKDSTNVASGSLSKILQVNKNQPACLRSKVWTVRQQKQLQMDMDCLQSWAFEAGVVLHEPDCRNQDCSALLLSEGNGTHGPCASDSEWIGSSQQRWASHLVTLLWTSSLAVALHQCFQAGSWVPKKNSFC